MGLRKNWRQETWELYDEGGRAIGRLLCYEPHREPEMWKLVAGLGLWKRWHLQAFKSWWRIENPQEYNRIKSKRCYQKQERAKRAAKLSETREASTEAMLTDNEES